MHTSASSFRQLYIGSSGTGKVGDPSDSSGTSSPPAGYCSGTRSAMSSHMTGLEGSKPPVTAWMAV